MLAHPYFPELLLHPDRELAAALGTTILQRRTIHEWPLSCVQKLITDDGRSFAYKSQLPPSVEAEFYRRASSVLLPGHRELDPVAGCTFLLIDWIDSPSLSALTADPSELLTRGRELVDGIGAITGNLPQYLDLGTVESWGRTTEVTIAKAATLIRDGRFSSIDQTDLHRLRGWAESVAEQATAGTRLINGDLRADQVLITPAGYRVLDWQRPVITRPEVDLVSLLLAEDLEPRNWLDPLTDRIFWLIRLHWTVVAQHDLFPDAAGTYDNWARQAVRRILD